MKLRYDFNASNKTYRTFPQKVAQSTGLADRWSILRWCCPFCYEKPKSKSRKSSGVPVIRITRPRSPDSDSDEEEEELRERRGSGEPITTSPQGSGGWGDDDKGSIGSSIGSGDLDVIDEERDLRDYDSDSVKSKSSVRSKSSAKSKSSVTDSVKGKSSKKGKGKESPWKNSKESVKSSRDSLLDKDSSKEKPKSPVKKILKHLRRSTSSSSHDFDKRSSTKSSSSLGSSDGEKQEKPSKWRSMTLDNRSKNKWSSKPLPSREARSQTLISRPGRGEKHDMEDLSSRPSRSETKLDSDESETHFTRQKRGDTKRNTKHDSPELESYNSRSDRKRVMNNGSHTKNTTKDAEMKQDSEYSESKHSSETQRKSDNVDLKHRKTETMHGSEKRGSIQEETKHERNRSPGKVSGKQEDANGGHKDSNSFPSQERKDGEKGIEEDGEGRKGRDRHRSPGRQIETETKGDTELRRQQERNSMNSYTVDEVKFEPRGKSKTREEVEEERKEGGKDKRNDEGKNMRNDDGKEGRRNDDGKDRRSEGGNERRNDDGRRNENGGKIGFRLSSPETPEEDKGYDWDEKISQGTTTTPSENIDTFNTPRLHAQGRNSTLTYTPLSSAPSTPNLSASGRSTPASFTYTPGSELKRLSWADDSTSDSTQTYVRKLATSRQRSDDSATPTPTSDVTPVDGETTSEFAIAPYISPFSSKFSSNSLDDTANSSLNAKSPTSAFNSPSLNEISKSVSYKPNSSFDSYSSSLDAPPSLKSYHSYTDLSTSSPLTSSYKYSSSSSSSSLKPASSSINISSSSLKPSSSFNYSSSSSLRPSSSSTNLSYNPSSSSYNYSSSSTRPTSSTNLASSKLSSSSISQGGPHSSWARSFPTTRQSSSTSSSTYDLDQDEEWRPKPLRRIHSLTSLNSMDENSSTYTDQNSSYSDRYGDYPHKSTYPSSSTHSTRYPEKSTYPHSTPRTPTPTRRTSKLKPILKPTPASFPNKNGISPTHTNSLPHPHKSSTHNNNSTPTSFDPLDAPTFSSPPPIVISATFPMRRRSKREKKSAFPAIPECTVGEADETGGNEDTGGGGVLGGGQKSSSPSPRVGSMGRLSGRDSLGSLASSSDATSCLTQPDEEIERLFMMNERKSATLTPLGSRSESMASVCSAGAEGRYGTVTVRGEVELGLQYNYKEGQLEVHIIQCRDLAPVDVKRNRSDPYVKVYLLPDKSKSGKRKTKVKKHTLNPVFEEHLKFSTTMSELESRALLVSVWHSDMFGRNDFLGEVIVPMSGTVFDDTTPKAYPLQDRTEPLEDLSYSPRGDLIMALKFVPPDALASRKPKRSRGALHVLVKEAKSLAPVRPHGSADPVCKGLLLPEKGKASKQKTSVCRKTLSPTWNHTLVFDDTSLQDLTERALELSVWDHDRLAPSQFLGGCRLSLGKGKHNGKAVEWMEAAGMEVKLWEQMLERPNLWVEGAIMLRTSMDKPIYSSSMTE